MSDEKYRNDEDTDRAHMRHPFAMGILAGAAVGAGVGLLFAPRSGAQTRQEIGRQLTHMKHTCSTGYHKAKDAASDWAGRGGHAYGVTREKVVHGAQETRQYVREVADAVTRKSHRERRGAATTERTVPTMREPARTAGTLT